jgi:site-specific DNA recombinase
MKTAYAYARFSSDNQREESIDAQVRAIMEYAAREDIHVLRVYKDEAFSARTDKRPAFQELFGMIREHPADLLIVHKLDRFARNRMDAAFYRSKLKEANMRLVSVLERIDDSPESIIMEGVIEAMNEYYSANLSRESKKGMRENVLQGKRNGGKAPFGYTIVNQHLIPNGDAEKVRSMFRMYAEGEKLATISDKLKLPFTNYRAVLKNEAYIGTLKSGEWKQENAHEAIIDRETWELVQKRMGDASLNAANKATHFYLLSGMIVCGECGRRLTCGNVGNKYFYYRCKTKGCHIYKEQELDERVIQELSKAFTPTDAIKAKFYELVQSRVNSRANSEQSKKLRLLLSQRISKLIDSLQYSETSEDAKNIMAKVSELRKQMPPEPKKSEPADRAACDKFIDELFDIQSHDPEIQRMILRKTIDNIVVKPKELLLFTTIQKGICVVVNKKGFK